MSADTTLLSLPNTPTNLEVAEYLTWVRWFTDDVVHRDEDGTVLATEAGPTRDQFERKFYWDQLLLDRVPRILDLRILDVCPSYAGHTSAVRDDHVRSRFVGPIVVTPAVRAELMVTYTRQHSEFHRYWNWRPAARLNPDFRREDDGWGVGRRHARVTRGYRRVARPQDVRRWLDAQLGRLVWAEVW